MYQLYYIDRDATLYERKPTQNTGIDPIVELTKIASGSNFEGAIQSKTYNTRILLDFATQITALSQSIVNGEIPKLGSHPLSASVYLTMIAADASDLPLSFDLKAFPVSQSWVMGNGYKIDNPITKKGVSWFSGLNKIVTNSPIRYIIPIDQTRGIVMISYTDGLDAKYWIREDEIGGVHGNENVKELIMTEIRKLFPDRTIPDPIFFKQHPWYDGCTYWLPGNYNVREESIKSLHPLPISIPNLYMCGESFAVKQCWIESALDQADNLLNHNGFSFTLRNI
jgi:hypothetical protein